MDESKIEAVSGVEAGELNGGWDDYSDLPVGDDADETSPNMLSDVDKGWYGEKSTTSDKAPKGFSDEVGTSQKPLTERQREGAPRAAAEDLGENIEDFFTRWPELTAKDIPQSVWEEAANGKGLITAYALHENARLRLELETERQNARNRLLSVGSRGSEGRAEARSDIERFWYEED